MLAARHVPERPASLNGMIAPLPPFAVKGHLVSGRIERRQADRVPHAVRGDIMISAALGPILSTASQLSVGSEQPKSDNWHRAKPRRLHQRTKNGCCGHQRLGRSEGHSPAEGTGWRSLGPVGLANTYGQKVEFSGPAYKTLKVEGNKVVLSFDHVGGGLVIQKYSMPGAEDVGKDGKLVGFTIAGEDKVFHPATATIEDDTVVVTSEQVSKPVAVRYGWLNFPVTNLANKAGIPASPFRTDDFPTTLK